MQMLEFSVEKQSAKKTKQGQRPALDSSSFTPVPSDSFFSGVAAIGRAAGFSSLRPGPHPPGGQQCHVIVTLSAAQLRVDNSYLISFNLSSGLSCSAPWSGDPTGPLLRA
jgi:hypothetical protein